LQKKKVANRSSRDTLIKWEVFVPNVERRLLFGKDKEQFLSKSSKQELPILDKL
jgi:hypothetical protein